MPRSRTRASTTRTVDGDQVDLATAGTMLSVEVPAMAPEAEGLDAAKQRADLLQEHLSELVPLLREAIEDISPASMLRAELQCSLPVIMLVIEQCRPAAPVTAEGEAGRNPWGGARRTASPDRDGDTDLMPQRPFSAERARVAIEHARTNDPLPYLESPEGSMVPWTGGVTPASESSDDPVPAPPRPSGMSETMVIVDDPIAYDARVRGNERWTMSIDGVEMASGDAITHRGDGTTILERAQEIGRRRDQRRAIRPGVTATEQASIDALERARYSDFLDQMRRQWGMPLDATEADIRDRINGVPLAETRLTPQVVTESLTNETTEEVRRYLDQAISHSLETIRDSGPMSWAPSETWDRFYTPPPPLRHLAIRTTIDENIFSRAFADSVEQN